ncbi:hypothetical protein GOP47_0028350 [Adiantum capillus-veneris]|nr:hypothetical protein GOP47_0028350 [Adiantum capillus-veneris]
MFQVLDATSNEPWGPHGTLMAEIAQATRNHYELQMIMALLWKRLSDTGHNWRHVYKALTVLEYLVAHGSEKVIDDIVEHVYQITTLADFQYVETNGKDHGINVRKKSQSLVLLVNDKEKIREVRQKAADNRDKYVGVSSSGGMSKPSSYQSTGGSYAGEENYGRYGSSDDSRYSRDGDVSRHRDDDRYGGESDRSSRHSDLYRDHQTKDYDEDVDYHGSHKRDDDSNTAHNKTGGLSSRELKPSAAQFVNTSSENNISDEFDDFNPRATSGTGPTAQLDDLFNSNGVVKTSPPQPGASSLWEDTSDLFGDSVSTNVMPPNIVQNLGEDLFGSSSFKGAGSGSTSSVAVKVAIKPPPSYTPPGIDSKELYVPTSGTVASSVTRPATSFVGSVPATVASATFDTLTHRPPSANQAASVGDDFLGFEYFSASGSLSSYASQPAFSLNASAPSQPALSGAFHTGQSLYTSSFKASPPIGAIASQGKSGNTRSQQEKGFETKSAVWADGLSKGLIDLNIVGPKSNPRADIEVVQYVATSSSLDLTQFFVANFMVETCQ